MGADVWITISIIFVVTFIAQFFFSRWINRRYWS